MLLATALLYHPARMITFQCTDSRECGYSSALGSAWGQRRSESGSHCCCYIFLSNSQGTLITDLKKKKPYTPKAYGMYLPACGRRSQYASIRCKGAPGVSVRNRLWPGKLKNYYKANKPNGGFLFTRKLLPLSTPKVSYPGERHLALDQSEQLIKDADPANSHKHAGFPTISLCSAALCLSLSLASLILASWSDLVGSLLPHYFTLLNGFFLFCFVFLLNGF